MGLLTKPLKYQSVKKGPNGQHYLIPVLGVSELQFGISETLEVGFPTNKMSASPRSVIESRFSLNNLAVGSGKRLPTLQFRLFCNFFNPLQPCA